MKPGTFRMTLMKEVLTFSLNSFGFDSYDTRFGGAPRAVASTQRFAEARPRSCSPAAVTRRRQVPLLTVK